MVIVLTLLAWASVSPAQQPERRIELNLFGGFAWTGVKGAATYGDSWNLDSLSNADESAAISSISKNAPFFGAGLDYFLRPHFGLGLSIEYLRSGLDTRSSFHLSWTWSPLAGGATGSRSGEWISAGNFLTRIPISVNFFARFGEGPIQGFVQGGPAVYFNKATLDSSIAYGVSDGYEYIDAARLPINARDLKSGTSSWMGIGANFGGGLIYKIGPSLGLDLEARYFFCPDRELDWRIGAGTFVGILGQSSAIEISSVDTDYLYDYGLISKIRVNPSFFQLRIGLKIKI
jgi:opacity protein-like surface antigen